MPSVEEEITRLKAGIATAAKAQAQAQQQRAVAEDRVRQALEDLREEFGITPEEAPATLERLNADLAAEAERVRELLRQAQGEQS